MRVWVRAFLFTTLFVILLGFSAMAQQPAATVPAGKAPAVRERLSMDKGWHFALGDATGFQKDFGHATVPFFFAKAGYGDGPASPKFDDRTWRSVNLPHDWAVELPFDWRGDGNHGSKAIGKNFPQNSVGWYRRSFVIPKQDEGRRIVAEFDGIYRDATVWINGFYLGEEHSGYSSTHYDLTNYLNYGGENVLVVRVNASIEEGWFYEGAGIYRHVWLTKENPLHVAHDGVFVRSEVKGKDADVAADVTVQNDGAEAAQFTVEEQVLDASGKAIATAEAVSGSVAAKSARDLSGELRVHDARLWSLEDPYLHKLVTTVRVAGQIVDRYETSFGIRTIRFDPDHGFFLNGKHVELKGTNDHQDHAGVGTAIPDSLNEYRVQRLKAFGSNAIRTSHNPPTPELLDACDRLGMLVLDENRQMGTTPEVMDQLQRMILRDRNHPSVILWSVGNEEWSLEWSETGQRLTREMQAFVKHLDPTRLSTVALSGSGGNGNSASTEVLGFNYYLQHNIDQMHARYPSRPIVGTEESSSMHTRGVYADDLDHQHLVAYDYESNKKHASIEEGWQYHISRPFSAGLFYWTGFDYRGETTPFGWPAISSQFGVLDACGFFKDSAYLLQSWWTEAPMVHLLPHWNWPGREGQPVDVRVYSNADEVELFLNGQSLGRKAMPKNSHLEWKVAYTPGKLTARGYAAGKEIASDTVETTTAPAALQLTPNHTEMPGETVSVIEVRVNDAQGRFAATASNLVSFKLTGPGKILGVGNGDPSSHEPDQYLETVSTIAFTSWKTHATEVTSLGAEAATDFNDSAWPAATDPRWDETRIDPPASLYRGVFVLPELPADAAVKLVLRSVGEKQSISLNGHILAADQPRSPHGYEFVLDRKLLLSGKNVLTVLATRFNESDKKEQAFHWNDGGPAAIQLTLPAPQWQRSVFNGLAQVIVQSTGQAGEITLEATAPGLAPATIKLRALPAEGKAQVPEK
jgi:beta-galactosidase